MMQNQTKVPYALNLKRTKGKCVADYTLKDAYKYYMKEVKHIQKTNKTLYNHLNITFKKYTEIVRDKYITNIVERIFEGEVFDIPKSLGKIYIQKKKMPVALLNESKALKIDFMKSAEIGKRVVHLNEHSNNHRYRIAWLTGKKIFTGSRTYKFIPTRANNRRLAKTIKTDPNRDYFF